MINKFYTIQQASEILDITPARLYQIINEKKIAKFSRLGRTLIRKRDVNKLMQIRQKDVK